MSFSTVQLNKKNIYRKIAFFYCNTKHSLQCDYHTNWINFFFIFGLLTFNCFLINLQNCESINTKFFCLGLLIWFAKKNECEKLSLLNSWIRAREKKEKSNVATMFFDLLIFVDFVYFYFIRFACICVEMYFVIEVF